MRLYSCIALDPFDDGPTPALIVDDEEIEPTGVHERATERIVRLEADAPGETIPCWIPPPPPRPASRWR